MSTKTPIKSFPDQRILGYIETDSNGMKRATDFYGKILGKYDPATNKTTDFYGRILATGDVLSGLIYEEANKH